jgi:two-component sensor histidine kinase
MAAIDRPDETRTETLLRGLQSSGLGVVYHDADLAVRMVENLPRLWPPVEVIFATGVAAVFDPFTAERVRGAKRDVLSSGVPQRIEAPLRPDGGDLSWFELSFEPDLGGGGPARGLFVTVTDITQIKRREAALRDLLFEVSHRSRNMLAILQSILGQTAGKATSVGEFEEKFRGRIASIAQSQDLITYANWQAVRFSRLAEAQIAAFLEDGGATPQIEGLDPLLSPNDTLHLGLALHELAANSAMFGVLGAGAGTIRILTTALPGGYRVEWIEVPAQPMAPPADNSWGFGRTVLQHVVPRALRTQASYAIDDAGVHYALDLREPGEDATALDAQLQA